MIESGFEFDIGELPFGFGTDRIKRDPSNRGYSLGDSALVGGALLIDKNHGVNLVYRLKDTLPMLLDEIAFWGKQLALLVPDEKWDYVSHAPSSGKRPDSEHLATLLAVHCAKALGLPMIDAFSQPVKRGNRGSRLVKLAELSTRPYVFTGEPGRIVVVDDVVFTRSTAKRCSIAAVDAGAQAFFAILYKA